MFKSLRYINLKAVTYFLLISIVSSNYNLCLPDAQIQISNYSINSLHISNDHEYLVIGSIDNSTYILKHNGSFFQIQKQFTDSNGKIMSVSISQNHNIVISGTQDTKTYVYQKQSDQSTHTLNQTIQNQVVINSVTLSKNGDMLVIGGVTGITKIYERQNNFYNKIQQISRSSNNVKSVSLSQDGTQLAIGYQTGLIQTYMFDSQSENFQTIQNITDNTDQIIAMSFIAGKIVVDGSSSLKIGYDQNYLVFATQSQVTIYRHANGIFSFFENITECSNVNSATLEPHKDFLAVGCADNRVYVYKRKIQTAKYLLHELLEDSQNSIMSVSFDERGQYLAVGDADGKIRVYHNNDRYSKPQRDDSRKVIIMNEVQDDRIGVGILIGVLIGFIATLAGSCLYCQYLKRRPMKTDNPSAIMNQGQLEEQTQYKSKNLSQNSRNFQKDKQIYEPHLAFEQDTEGGKKSQIFKGYQKDQKQSMD